MEKTRGNQVDLLHGSIMKSLVIFALPILISNVFQQMYNTVDTMMVGNILGETALAAIGASSPIYDLLVGFALGIGGGLSIVTARSYGTGNRELLKRSVACAMLIGTTAALAITVLAQAGAYPLLQLLNTPQEIIGEAKSYISTITLFTLVMVAYNLCSGLLQATGNSLAPLIFLMISSVLNIGLDYLFIAKTDMGIRGAAVATVISQGVSVILCIGYIFRCCQMLVPEKKHFRVDKSLFLEMMEQGLAVAFMRCIVSAGSVILQYGINGLGYLTIAGHTTARKIYMFCNMPFTSIASAVSTFVSQNRGAGQRERIRRAIRSVIIYNIVMAAAVTVFLGFTAPALVSWISGSKETVILENGSEYLRVVAPFYAVLGAVFDLRFALQGLGKKILPLVSSLIEFVGKILFVVILIPHFQYQAVIFCEPAIWCVMAVQLAYSFLTNHYLRGEETGK